MRIEKNLFFFSVHYLTPINNVIFCNREEVNTKIPSIYCYLGQRKEMNSIWKTISVSFVLFNGSEN